MRTLATRHRFLATTLQSLLLVSLPTAATAASPTAVDVNSAAARTQTLLDYVAARTDIPAADRQTWDKELRREFGGKALNDGSDEGITVAKSVVSAAIFFGIAAKTGAKAALAAYHDTYSYVPPPLAINYQLLAFQGRKPSVSAKQLAFRFPRYFNEDLAPDLVAWWRTMLDQGKIPPLERPDIERLLQETLPLCRPMLRDRLMQGAALEARLTAAKRGGNAQKIRAIERDLESLSQELERSFKGVADDAAVMQPGPYYNRYLALSRELGLAPEPQPSVPAEVAPPKPLPPPAPAPAPAPKPEPSAPALPFAEVKPTPPATPAKPAVDAPKPAETRPAPLAGDPLPKPFPKWREALKAEIDHWIGTPYRWGGTARSGADCSGFVQQVFRATFGIELPRNARAQATVGTPIELRDLQNGDLVFFDTLDQGRITHVGIYVDERQLAHASSSVGVTRSDLQKSYYQRAYRASRRLLTPK